MWPKGWPRVERREQSKFQTEIHSALNNLKRQIELMGGKQVVLSSNCTLGTDNPADPGVCAYFQLRETPMAIPCDRWTRVRDNVHAIALTVEAMRGMERWGAKHMITAMFSGFRALPQKASGIDPWKILGIDSGANEDEITAAYRLKSKSAHPDNKVTGSVEAWAELREATDLAMASAKGRK